MEEKTKKNILDGLNNQVEMIKIWIDDESTRKNMEFNLRLGAQGVLTHLGLNIEFDEKGEKFTEINPLF